MAMSNSALSCLFLSANRSLLSAWAFHTFYTGLDSKMKLPRFWTHSRFNQHFFFSSPYLQARSESNYHNGMPALQNHQGLNNPRQIEELNRDPKPSSSFSASARASCMNIMMSLSSSGSTKLTPATQLSDKWRQYSSSARKDNTNWHTFALCFVDS